MNENKWWEFYIIRYSMGAIIGAAIVFALLNSNLALKQFLLLPNDKPLEYFHFIFLAVYGLTYCYVASAPILVFHAARFSFSYGKNKRVFKPVWYIYMAIAMSLLMLAAFIYPSIISMAKAMLIILAILVLLPQWILVFYSVVHIKDNYEFYKTLAQKRESDKTDIRESYKHLREHGNSFGILFFEIILGVLLISLGYEHIGYTLGFIFLWVLPAVCVWFIGTGLENQFVTD